VHENFVIGMTGRWFLRSVGVLLFASAFAVSLGAGNRVRIAPNYIAGETFRYLIESRTTTSGKVTTPILNPEGAGGSTVSIHLEVLLDVLDASGSSSQSVPRLRAVYEKSKADAQSDAFDPAQPSPSAQYAKLEGRSLEFTVDSRGHLGDITGIEDIFPDRTASPLALSWFSEIAVSSTFPATGIAVGQKWKSERPVEGAPLSDLIFRAESTYLRDEPCHPEAAAAGPANAIAIASDVCAVILTRFAILRRGSPHSEATPDDYVRNGLRVSGSWTGSGESLDSISLATGFLVRSTQTSDQQTDYEIASASTGSKIHNQRRIQSQSEISLVSAAAAVIRLK
jgi:hypothetical protein